MRICINADRCPKPDKCEHSIPHKMEAICDKDIRIKHGWPLGCYYLKTSYCIEIGLSLIRE